MAADSAGRLPNAVTLQRVSHAVWECVAEDGIEATTVRNVANRAGCTTGLIMHHFGSRAAMITHARALLYERSSARADAVEQIIADPRQRLIEVLSGVLTLDKERRQEARVWMGFAAAFAAQPELLTTHINGNHQWLARIIRLLHTCAPVDPDQVRQKAIELVALVEGLAMLSTLDPVFYTDKQQITTLRSGVTAALDNLKGAT